MKNVCMLALCGFVAGTLMARVQMAYAVDAFKKSFDAMYVKKEPTTDAEKSLAAAVEKAKCNICHVGKTKKVRNDYGKAVGALVTKKDAKDDAKIEGSLEEGRRREVEAGRRRFADLWRSDLAGQAPQRRVSRAGSLATTQILQRMGRSSHVGSACFLCSAMNSAQHLERRSVNPSERRRGLSSASQFCEQLFIEMPVRYPIGSQFNQVRGALVVGRLTGTDHRGPGEGREFARRRHAGTGWRREQLGRPRCGRGGRQPAGYSVRVLGSEHWRQFSRRSKHRGATWYEQQTRNRARSCRR